VKKRSKSARGDRRKVSTVGDAWAAGSASVSSSTAAAPSIPDEMPRRMRLPPFNSKKAAAAKLRAALRRHSTGDELELERALAERYEDDMSYETLSKLQNVVVPLSDVEIQNLPVMKYVDDAPRSSSSSSSKGNAVNRREDGVNTSCTICLFAFENGQTLTVLPPCCHRFHGDCIVPWLRVSKKCPICKQYIA